MSTLTKRQHEFCIAYVESRNISKSAMVAGYSNSYAKSKSHLLLKNPAILEQVTHLSKSYYKTHFEEIATTAIKELSDVVQDSENRATQFKAIQYVLAKAGVTEQVDSKTGTIEIKVRLPHDLQH